MSTTIASMGEGRVPGSNPVSTKPVAKAANPIAYWLQRFARRQARLQVAQGLGVALTSALLGAACILGLDALGWIDDATRWVLSTTNYALALGLGSRFGLSRLWRAPNRAQLASFAEKEASELGESLLSCVELQDIAPEHRHFSSQFLDALEVQVAQKLEGLRPSQLLPWKHVRRPLILALLGIVAMTVPCLWPSLEMPQRLARAFLPWIELSRPTRTKILVRSPSRETATVPEHQRIAFEIELAGESSDTAYLELKSQGNVGKASVERVEMKLVQRSPAIFACTAPVAAQSLQYRFFAGDAKTAYRQLNVTPRPRVLQFHPKITFPEYTKLGVQERTLERGGLTMLSNSRLEVRIEPSMPLRSASILVDSLDASEKVNLPLAYDAAKGWWVGTWNMSGDAKYQVKMVADVPDAEQSIENTYSPFHEVDTVTDHTPSVVWVTDSKTYWDRTPTANRGWMVMPEQIVPMAASLADDLPGATLEQEISINRQPWVRVGEELPTVAWGEESASFASELIAWPALDGVEQPTRGTAHWNWDVLTSGAVSGDVVAVRVVAKDSLGQRTVSPVLQFSIASPGFDRSRHDALYQKASLAGPMKELADWMKLQKAELRPKLAALKERSTSMPTRRETALEIDRFVLEWKRRGEGLRQQARSVVGTLPRFLDQSELEFVHRVLAKWERENLSAIELVSKSDAWEGLGDQDQPPPLLLERLLPQLQQQVDFAVSSLDVLESGSTQLNDQFRQLLGHDCLTALTKDLMYLWNHQKETVARAEKMDFAMLARSQSIAEQIIDAVTEVGEKIEPSVSNHLRDQLKNLYRFLDQTRNELKDLTQVEGTSQAYQNLLQRIQRSVSDLQGQHWAFNLDGGLWWSVADTRRQLIQSGHGIGQAMDRVVVSGLRTAEWMRDGRLDSAVLQKLRSAMAEEMALSHLPATSAMIDRRDFHLRRQPTDPMFPGDMGLAHRAWRGQMEAWWEQQPGSPAWSETLASLQAIAKAYRVLEVAHEIQDIRGTLEVLKRQEQYDWESLEGRFSHLKQWESVNHRVDMAHHWMREAGFPNPIPDKLNALRWTPNANEIRQSLEPRRNAGNTQLLSVAEALQQHLEEWTQVQRLAQPTIEDARRLLAKYAPSVSELAKQAAAKTRVLQQQSESLASNSPTRRDATETESSPTANQKPSEESASPDSESAVAEANSTEEKVDASPQSIAAQQRQVERSIAQLQEALLDAALSQDILDAKQLQIAKDSDRALDLIDRVHEPMLSAQAALAEAQRSSKNANDVGEAAKEAATTQERAAEAMEVIANHFANIEQSATEADTQREAALEQSRQALAQQQRSMESDSQASDSQAASESPSAATKESDPLASYSKADQLNEMARNSPDALLKQLEAELRRNRPMQKELSSISKSTVADSVSQLQDAAKREASIAQSLENSDSLMTEAKVIEVQQLKALADNADRMAADLLNKGTQAIQRMNQPESVRALQRSAEQLRQSANQARHTDARATQESLKEKTQALNEAVQKAQQQLSEIAPRVQQLVDQNTFKEDKQRQSQLTEMQSWQSLMRDDLVRRAKDITREREQNVEHLRKEAEQRKREQEQKVRERQQAIDQANAQPQNEGLKGQIDQKTKELSQAAQRAESATRVAESAQGLAKQAQEQMQRIEQAARANLDAPNPLAALGREQLSAAKEQLDQLQSALQGLQGQTSQPTDRAPSADALASSQPQQKGVQESIHEVSEQLSRSARHEERLGNDAASQRLNEQSQQVSDQVQPAVDRAADMLEQSASNARASESEQAKQARGEANPKPMRSPSSEGTLQGLKQAEETLQRQAEALQQAFGQGASQRSSQSAPQQSSPSQQSSDPSSAQSSSPSTSPSTASSEASRGQGEASPSDSTSSSASSDPIPSAKQLARMLDALDRQLNSGGESTSPSSKPSSPKGTDAQSATQDNRPSDGDGSRQENAKQDDSSGERNQGKGAKPSPGAVQDALRESAEQVASQLQNERLAQRQKSRDKSNAPKRPSTQPGGQPNDDGNTRGQPTGNSSLPAVSLEVGSDWGRLREKRADDVTEGRREIYDPEFSDAIRAYYRALARPRQP